MHSCQIISITSQDIVFGNAGSFIRFPKFKQQKKKLVLVYIFFFITKFVWLLAYATTNAVLSSNALFFICLLLFCVYKQKNVNIN